MNKTITIILAAALVMGSCATVPVTGRKQVLLVNDSEVLSASLTEYQSYMKTAHALNQRPVDGASGTCGKEHSECHRGLS